MLGKTRGHPGAAQNEKIQESREKIHKKQVTPNCRYSAKGKNVGETSFSSEICLVDIMDGIVKARGSIGYIADNSQDEQLTSLLMLIEESLGITEQGLQYIIGKGIEGEIAEDVPFA